jgi:predicted RNase H-like HicB family nuclease
MATYIALVQQTAVGRCRASFPDLPGCVAAGDSLHEAIAMAALALADHVQHLLGSASRFRCPAWSMRSIVRMPSWSPRSRSRMTW